MKRNKGFTLIELLAVIVVLAIILAIAVPSITNIIKSSLSEAFKSDAKMLLKAIDYKKLEDEGFNATNVNQSNIEDLLGLSNENYSSLSITVEDNTPIIKIVGKSKWNGLIACGNFHNMKIATSTSECGTDLVLPVITLLGNNPEDVIAGTTYTDSGATATDNTDGDVTSKIVATGTVNPSVVGSYTITYTVTDTAGNIATLTRTVNVIDNIAPVITINGSSTVAIDQGSTYTDAGATATDNLDTSVTVNTTGTVNTNIMDTYTITYTASDTAGNAATPVTRTVIVQEGANGPGYIASEGVNGPALVAGMTPVKWNGSSWVTTTESDTDWYNYTTTDKKWANAKTADGSMWVWIPRYIYKISSGWHTSTAGTINIQFSIGTDDTIGGTVTLDTGTTANASNNKWTNHPAFTFGTKELNGIWMAKFEASGTTSAINSVPNANALLSIKIGSMFTSTRNMRTNSRYGWGTTGSNIDTHMAKNTEWGAATYLSRSTYGKTSEIVINNSAYITGYGNGSTYNTATGMQASTTGNIYGIYDMDGGAWEYTAAYVNNGDANLTTCGSSIISASSKYKEVYTMGATDTQADNFAASINKKGDVTYETSASVALASSWFTDYSYMPFTTYPYFLRGGRYADGVNSGAYAYSAYTGCEYSAGSFRPILLVGEGL